VSARFVLAASIAIVGCAHGGAVSHGVDETRGPADPLALRRSLARTLIDHHAWDDAARPLKELIAWHPEDAQAHALLGVVYREKGLPDAAEDELRRAIRLDDKAAAPHSDLGILYDGLGKSDAALVEHRRAVALAPADAAWQNNLGFSLYLAGHYDEAITTLLVALRADPSSRRARNNLGFAYGRKGDLESARRQFAEAGGEAQVENNLGLVYERLGDRDRACESFRRAALLAPRLDEATANQRRACEDPTRKTEARLP
jgi:Flp pilus assembly protein TadD